MGKLRHGCIKNGAIPDGYNAWNGMIKRCYNPLSRVYRLYGARGITVCDRWRNSLSDFLVDIGPRPSKYHSIDRINNDGNYEPANCRWATQSQQCRNRRNNRTVTHDGVTATITEWAERTGIGYRTLLMRANLGWSPVDILTMPLHGTRHGEGSRNSKLTESDVREIREWKKAGATYSQLAKNYGTSMGAIQYVLLRGWKHVA